LSNRLNRGKLYTQDKLSDNFTGAGVKISDNFTGGNNFLLILQDKK